MKRERKRRGRGEGSIFQRADGQWVGRVSLGYTDDGRQRRITVYAATKGEVQDKLRQLQTDASTGRIGEAGALTVADYLDRWLATHKARVAPTTHLRYEGVVKKHLKPTIGYVRLAKLTGLHVEGMYATLEKEGFSARARQLAGITLGRALKDAVRLRLIPYSPAAGIAKPRSARKEMNVLTAEQARAFLAAAEGDRLHAMYVLALDSGARQGELFGLTWGDLDLDGGQVVIRRTLEELKGQHRLKEPKTSRSRRRIALAPLTVEALRAHRLAMLKEGHYRSDGPVFCDVGGGWLRKSNVQRRSFEKVISRANDKAREKAEEKGGDPALLPAIRFHDLRHTSATLLLLADESPKVVAERLGHASVTITLDTYSHVLPGMGERAAAKMQTLLGGRGVG